jgi:hypothetical protein
LPWNVGLYDSDLGRGDNPDGYTESVGAESREEAVAISDAWINHEDEKMHKILVHGLGWSK